MQEPLARLAFTSPDHDSTMTIVCIGWGSLIWDSRALRIAGTWHIDGPLLPIEFARQSADGRLTLVITAGAAPVRTLWCKLAVNSQSAAVNTLKHREGTSASNIGCWVARDSVPLGAVEQTVSVWARRRAIRCVVWTALPPKWDNQVGRAPTLEEAVSYCETFHSTSSIAEYVRMAPRQIRTEFRDAIEQRLGWTPLSEL